MSEQKPNNPVPTVETILSKGLKLLGAGGLLIDTIFHPGINAESSLIKAPFVGLLILAYLININENLKNKK